MTAPQFDPNAELQAAQAAVRNWQHRTAAIHLARLLPQFPTHPSAGPNPGPSWQQKSFWRARVHPESTTSR
jgi:hypothetical protein